MEHLVAMIRLEGALLKMVETILDQIITTMVVDQDLVLII